MRQQYRSPDEIDQLVTVSCTGFSAPGVDIGLVESLGLKRDVSRTHVGFMGCHGALNGLRVAAALSHASPASKVLLCCVELCSIHHQYAADPQQVVANASIQRWRRGNRRHIRRLGANRPGVSSINSRTCCRRLPT